MKTIMITALILIRAICSQAQNKVPASHGFWVVERNINKPKVQTGLKPDIKQTVRE